MVDFRRPPLLIADGDIPTTRIVARLLAEGFGDVEVRPVERLFGADPAQRHVLISRLCHPRFRWLPGYLAARGIRYAYFLDDNFWELTAAIDVHLAAFYANPQVHRVLDEFITRAACCVVMSARLGRYVEARLPGVRTHCVIGGFDVELARSLAATTARAPKSPGEIRIGYPTSRRANVAGMLVPVVEEILRRHGNHVRFEFVGWAPDALTANPGVTLHPHVDDYRSYLAFTLSRGWDIGIAPLAGEVFESYKTSVKYREYGGCGVPAIYSRVPPYVDSVVDGETGLLVDNRPEAWIDALERMIADSSLRRRIADNACADVCANLSERQSAAQLEALLIGTAALAA
jgi:hypothetical protein